MTIKGFSNCDYGTWRRHYICRHWPTENIGSKSGYTGYYPTAFRCLPRCSKLKRDKVRCFIDDRRSTETWLYLDCETLPDSPSGIGIYFIDGSGGINLSRVNEVLGNNDVYYLYDLVQSSVVVDHWHTCVHKGFCSETIRNAKWTGYKDPLKRFLALSMLSSSRPLVLPRSRSRCSITSSVVV